MQSKSRKLVLKKQTLQTLSGRQLGRAVGGGWYIDSNITCDWECRYFFVFTC